MEVTAHELEGLQHRNGTLNSGECLPWELLHSGSVTNDADHRLGAPLGDVSLRIDLDESGEHMVDVLARCVRTHNDDQTSISCHDSNSSELLRLGVAAKTTADRG